MEKLYINQKKYSEKQIKQINFIIKLIGGK